MKNNLYLILTICLTIYTGCSKNDSAVPTEIDKTTYKSELPSEALDSDPMVLEKSFTGDYVQLIYPHEGHWGWFFIRDESGEAELLYRLLDLEVIRDGGNIAWYPADSKEGINIGCSRMMPRSQTEMVITACSGSINYRTGKVKVKSELSKRAHRPEKLDKDFDGKTLHLPADGSNQIAEFVFRGKDAKAMFDALDVAEQSYVDGQIFQKKGLNYYCERTKVSETKSTYKCRLPFDHKTGSVYSI